MPLFTPLLRLLMLFLNVYFSFKTLRFPRGSTKNGGRPTQKALVQRKREMKGCLAVWIVWCCFLAYERTMEPIVYLFIPFYSELKAIVILFLIFTRARGAEPIYLHVIRPFLRPYTSTLDALLEIAYEASEIRFIFIPIAKYFGLNIFSDSTSATASDGNTPEAIVHSADAPNPSSQSISRAGSNEMNKPPRTPSSFSHSVHPPARRHASAQHPRIRQSHLDNTRRMASAELPQTGDRISHQRRWTDHDSRPHYDTSTLKRSTTLSRQATDSIPYVDPPTHDVNVIPPSSTSASQAHEIWYPPVNAIEEPFIPPFIPPPVSELQGADVSHEHAIEALANSLLDTAAASVAERPAFHGADIKVSDHDIDDDMAWRQYPDFPSAYPATPLVNQPLTLSNSEGQRQGPHSDEYEPSIPEEGSEGSSQGQNTNARHGPNGFNTIRGAPAAGIAPYADDDTVSSSGSGLEDEEEEEDEDEDFGLKTPPSRMATIRGSSILGGSNARSVMAIPFASMGPSTMMNALANSSLESLDSSLNSPHSTTTALTEDTQDPPSPSSTGRKLAEDEPALPPEPKTKAGRSTRAPRQPQRPTPTTRTTRLGAKSRPETKTSSAPKPETTSSSIKAGVQTRKAPERKPPQLRRKVASNGTEGSKGLNPRTRGATAAERVN